MEISAKIQNLNHIANERENRLINYCQKENPNPSYVKSERQLIDDIRQAIDGFEKLEPADIWIEIKAQFERHKLVDKDGYVIYLPIKRNPNKGRFILIDFTEVEGVNDMEVTDNE